MNIQKFKYVLAWLLPLILLLDVAWAGSRQDEINILFFCIENIRLDICLLVDLILLVGLYKNKFTIGRLFYLPPTVALALNIPWPWLILWITDGTTQARYSFLVGFLAVELIFLPFVIGLYILTAKLIKKSQVFKENYHLNGHNADEVQLLILILSLLPDVFLLVYKLGKALGLIRNVVDPFIFGFLSVSIIATVAGLIIILKTVSHNKKEIAQPEKEDTARSLIWRKIVQTGIF